MDLEHGTCCVTFDVGSLANSGEDHLILYSGNLKEIVQREVDRLEAIETAREGLGKKYLWPRWGNPRRRGAGEMGCLNEIRLVVFKKGGRDDVSYTCLERRTFRSTILCDNCELAMNEENYRNMNMAEWQRPKDGRS